MAKEPLKLKKACVDSKGTFGNSARDLYLNALIEKETERALEAEESLRTAIDAEIARATEAENLLDKKIDTTAENSKNYTDESISNLRQEISVLDLGVTLNTDQVITGSKAFKTGNTEKANIAVYENDTVLEKTVTIKAPASTAS